MKLPCNIPTAPNKRRFSVGLFVLFAGCCLDGFGLIQTLSALSAQESGGQGDSIMVEMGDEKNQNTERQMEAWEYRPYQVAVWVAYDNCHRISAIEQQLLQEIETQTRIADPNAWLVSVQRAKNPWNWRLLNSVDKQPMTSELKLALNSSDLDANYDKLIVVTLNENLGQFETTVQELDLLTEVWGAEVRNRSAVGDLARVIYDGISVAFMPLTRIENVMDKNVLVRVRAARIVNRPAMNDDDQWEIVPNTGSPVWIDDQEILLPVILRNDRRGNVESITKVDWTFLSILDRSGSHLNCTTHAMQRKPLGGRTGSRTKRIGLCVRAPNRATMLKLISRDEDETVLPDLDVYSRRPGMTMDDASEYVGQTDWRGEIVIPPNEDGIRILYVQSGNRVLARAPLVPGLYGQQMARMPNDEKRLFAEGVVRGLQNELMDLLARRQILELDIQRLIDNKKLQQADEILQQLRDVKDSKEFNIRLNLEEKKLLGADERQEGYIKAMFGEIRGLSSKFLDGSKEAELSRQIRDNERVAEDSDQ